MKLSLQRTLLEQAVNTLSHVRGVQVRLGSPARLEVLVTPGADASAVEQAARSAGVENPVDVVPVPEAPKSTIISH